MLAFINSSRCWRSALRTVSTVFSIESGFSMKSNAPSFVARTAVSMFPCPDMITTAASDPAARSCLKVSSPSIPGSQTSSRMQPYARFPSAFRHSSPVATASASKPSSSITARSVSRMPRSSSTMRIESIRCCWQFDHETSAARMIALRANVTAVLHDYALHDRESETSAAVSSRKVRFKQPAEICRLDSLPCVRHFSAHLIRIVTRHDRDLSIAGNCRNRLKSVVDQIHKHAFDLFDVEHRRRQLAIEFESQI